MTDLIQMLDKLTARYQDFDAPANWPRVNVKRQPENILAQGQDHGYQWTVAHNRIGHRTGYIRVGRKHPWYGRSMSDSVIQDIYVHGGITYAEKGLPGVRQRFSYHWVLGFDCAHAGDAIDDDLLEESQVEIYAPLKTMRDGIIRTQVFVEAQCHLLCEQAAKAETNATQ